MARVWRRSQGRTARLPEGKVASFLADMGHLSIKRVPFGPRSKIRDEVIVVFTTPEVRDVVRSSARELAAHPEAGIRL